MPSCNRRGAASSRSLSPDDVTYRTTRSSNLGLRTISRTTSQGLRTTARVTRSLPHPTDNNAAVSTRTTTQRRQGSTDRLLRSPSPESSLTRSIAAAALGLRSAGIDSDVSFEGRITRSIAASRGLSVAGNVAGITWTGLRVAGNGAVTTWTGLHAAGRGYHDAEEIGWANWGNVSDAGDNDGSVDEDYEPITHEMDMRELEPTEDCLQFEPLDFYTVPEVPEPQRWREWMEVPTPAAAFVLEDIVLQERELVRHYLRATHVEDAEDVDETSMGLECPVCTIKKATRVISPCGHRICVNCMRFLVSHRETYNGVARAKRCGVCLMAVGFFLRVY